MLTSKQLEYWKYANLLSAKKLEYWKDKPEKGLKRYNPELNLQELKDKMKELNSRVDTAEEQISELKRLFKKFFHKTLEIN